MANFSDSFMEYLKIYNPNAYEIANSDGVKPEELTSIYNANIHRYEIWESIPATIRNRYQGQPVPPDVWEAASRGEIYTLREMEYDPEIKQVSEARNKAAQEYNVPADIISDTAATAAFLSALAAGYSAKACHELALNRHEREEMLKHKSEHMTDEEKERWLNDWLAVRQKDFNAIKKDWVDHQPEKMLMYLLGKHNRGHLNAEEKANFPQMIENLMQRIESPDNNRMQNLLAYIKTPRMQARIGRFNEETMDILVHTVLHKIPEDDREQYLARDFTKRREELRNMSDDMKAWRVSENIFQRAVNLPEERTLTAKERLANMPSALNQGRSM